MAPHITFLTLDLYTWAILCGIIAAMICFRVCASRVGLSDMVYTFALIVALPSIVCGYLSAVLFQSLYCFLETGVFAWGVGATFYGGLIGAAAVYLCIYFGVGHFVFRDRAHIAEFGRVVSLAAPCIVLAHAFGRIGCLMAGCCYGAVTDGPFGIMMYSGGIWARRVPVQLFECIFLFALFGVLMYLLLRKKCGCTAGIYLVAYGIWRFFIEFARADDRGSTGTVLTPSQLTAIVLVLVGVVLLVIYGIKKSATRS